MTNLAIVASLVATLIHIANLVANLTIVASLVATLGHVANLKATLTIVASLCVKTLKLIILYWLC